MFTQKTEEESILNYATRFMIHTHSTDKPLIQLNLSQVLEARALK